MAAVARTGTCAIVILRKMSRKPANKKRIRQEKLVVMVVKIWTGLPYLLWMDPSAKSAPPFYSGLLRLGSVYMLSQVSFE